MPTPASLSWLLIGGLFVTVFAAIGSRVLRDFSRRELELYCRARKRGRFNEIILHHDQVALAADTFLALGIAVSTLAGGARAVVLLLSNQTTISWGSLGAGIAVAAAALVTMTSWIPAAVVSNWSAPVVYHTWRLWRLATVLVWPLLGLARIVDLASRRISGRDQQTLHEEEEAFEDEIRSIVNAGLRDGLLEEDAREMIEGVIELGDVDVADVMTPRSKIDAIDAAWSWTEILEFLVRVKRTRIPVYRDSLDNVVGVLYVKDLLPHVTRQGSLTQVPLESLLRKAWEIPAKKVVDDLLHDFLENRHHIAIVLDEYDATCGVVTIEDALEKIVGEIHDEHESDAESQLPKWEGQQAEISASVHLDDIAEALGIEFPEDVESDTIGGLIIEQLGRIPKEGEAVTCNDILITVLAADRRRVDRVRLQRWEEKRETA